MVGASFDSVAENQAFRRKLDFPFPLLCDTTRSLGIAYGACADRKASHPNRITVVVGPDGAVAKVYPQVSAKTHAGQVLEDLGG